MIPQTRKLRDQLRACLDVLPEDELVTSIIATNDARVEHSWRAGDLAVEVLRMEIEVETIELGLFRRRIYAFVDGERLVQIREGPPPGRPPLYSNP